MSTIILLIAMLTAGHSVSSKVCSQKLDLVFILDGSSSICGGAESCPDWIDMLQFFKNIAASFNIGPNDTRVALMTVSSEGKLEWNFDQYPDINSLSSAIDKVVHPGGEIDSMFSIQNILTSLIVTAVSQRSEATVVAIVITDGAPRLATVSAAAVSTGLQALGMNVLMLGVTDRCDVNLVRSTSSPPRRMNETYFVVKDFRTIHHISQKLVKQICSFEGTSVLGAIVGGVSSILGF